VSRVQTLSQARGGWGPTLHQFEQIHKSKPDCLFCFFEGEDVKYYGFRIQENLPNMKWEGINCGGKAVIVKIYQLLKKHENASYQQAKKTFFIDRDFDEPLAEDLRQEIYETPCYSIENFYTTVDCFKDILKYEFKISEFGEDEKLFQQCLNFFEETQRRFHQVIIEFNAWIIAARKNQVELDLSSYDNIGKLVKIEVNSVEKCDELNKLSEREKLSIAINEVSKSFLNPRCEFRGKQELQFFIKFLTKLKDDLSTDHPKYFTQKRKISFPIPENNPLSALTQYAHTPECLRNYLVKFVEQ